jgi:hypothetical protein
MEFASEMVVKATLAGLRIREVPTTLSPDGRSRPPHLKSWQDGWKHLKLLLTFAPHWLFYYPGVALALAGTAMFGFLLGGPLEIGGVTFDIAALVLASALILVGFQLICFYALARCHAVGVGLLPQSQRFANLSAQISVDRACQFGLVLLVAGCVAAGGSVVLWSQAGWGDLDPSVIARPASFAVVCLSLGIQAITSGFLWGLLSSGAERRTSATAGAGFAVKTT